MDSGARSAPPGRSRWIHRYALVLAVLIVGLIAAGALVKSKEAGLSVPDWPLSYGSLNPPRWWQIENIRAEHGHRLYAGTVALLTVVLAFLVRRFEERREIRRLAYLAVAAVLLQALLGGITVLLFLPALVSVSHAALAQLFLCLVVTVAVFTSPRWRQAEPAVPPSTGLAAVATVTTVAVYAQILLGAVMRHTGAGLAIPDFPLTFGRLVPPHFDGAIAIHYSHRLGALLVAALVTALVVRVVRRHRREGHLVGPALALALLVMGQVALGGTVVLTGREVLPNTVHVAVGALLLATSLVLTLHSRRRLPATSATAVGAEMAASQVAS
jgi:cytochrome c oxidase assembly protein subunit 15